MLVYFVLNPNGVVNKCVDAGSVFVFFVVSLCVSAK